MKINPIDYYNFNHFDDAIEILKSINGIVEIKKHSFSVVLNRGDESVECVKYEPKNHHFIVVTDNHLFNKNDILTPFMIFQNHKHKNNFRAALNSVLSFPEYSGVRETFIRVGINYFKLIIKKSRDNIEYKSLKLWNRQTISDDYGNKFLSFIPSYNDFTINPNNVDYKQTIGNDYNLYAEFPHKPLDYNKENEETVLRWSLTLLRHIFGEQFELGVKYMKVLYEHPKQILPILVLVSEERGTGKTTFLNWLKMLFGDNMVIINPENISSQFNSSYATKNIAAIEESLFESMQATEKLKNLSTQKTILINTKNIQEYSIPSFLKIIITANNEDKFAKVDDPEIRYWVRKVPIIDNGKNKNNSIENNLKDEIPYFLKYLLDIGEINLLETRMVFKPDEIKTEQLMHVKQQSLPVLQKDILIKLDEYCMNNSDVELIEFTAIDIKKKFFDHENYSVSYIRTILSENMKLIASEPKRYISLTGNGIDKKIGRVYCYKNQYYNIDNAQNIFSDKLQTNNEDNEFHF
jgi:hypothetical protein